MAAAFLQRGTPGGMVPGAAADKLCHVCSYLAWLRISIMRSDVTCKCEKPTGETDNINSGYWCTACGGYVFFWQEWNGQIVVNTCTGQWIKPECKREQYR